MSTKFQDELASLINHYSVENGSDTPDFILAEYLDGCITLWNQNIYKREVWYGRKKEPTLAELGGILNPPPDPNGGTDGIS